MLSKPLPSRHQVIWLIISALAMAFPSWAQIGSNSCSLVASATWTNDLGSLTFQYTVNITATIQPYVSVANGNVYPFTSSIGTSVQMIDSAGDITGDGVVLLGQGGTPGDPEAPFTSTIFLASPDYFSTGIYNAVLDDYAAGTPVTFAFDVTGGPLSLSIPPIAGAPINLAPGPDGTNGLIVVQDAVTSTVGDLKERGVFGDQDSAALQDISIHLSPTGGELGTITLTIPVQVDRAWTDALSAQLDTPVHAGTVTVPVNYVRGDNIPQPTANISASPASLNVGAQSTLTVTVQNQSQAVGLASGQVTLDPSSLGGLSVVGTASQPLGTIAPQSSQTYTFTVHGAYSGSFTPQVLVTNGRWGWPAGGKDPFSALAQLPSAITVILPAPVTSPATSVASSSFTMNWNAVDGAAGYRLDVATDPVFTACVDGYQDLDVGSTTSQNVTGLDAGTPYYYRVRAYDSGGTSGNSDIGAATTLSRIISLGGNLAFGSVTVNNPVNTTLTISNAGNAAMTVTNITYSTNVFSGTWSGIIPAGSSTNVTLTFTPTQGVSYSGTVTVNCNATSGTNTASATGTGLSRVIALGGSLEFGNVTINTSSNKSLTITNTGNTTMNVASLTYSTNVFSGTWSGRLTARSWQSVTVTFRPTSSARYNGTVTVNCNSTSGTNTASVSGTGTTGTGATRIISLSGNLAFGSVLVGASAQRTLTIYNTGNSTMTVSNISFPTGFSGSGSGTIAASNSMDVTVTFSPVLATNYAGTVAVNSDATSGANTMSASGSGTGTAVVSLTSFQRTTNGFSLQWSDTALGQAYTVQSRDRMINSLWLMLDSPQPWPTLQTQWNLTISPTQSMRSYRVVGVQPATRGRIISCDLIQSFLFGVDFYKVVYETIDPLGARIQASGGLYLPTHVTNALPLFSWQHFTIADTNEAPSLNPYGELADIASSGYVTVAADYLGLGSGPGFHPYIHARSEATACVDMLRAARLYCASIGLPLNGQLFLAGFSQGGHATMALHRELEQYHSSEFTVTASAPMSGPYDMSGVELSDFLSSRCPPTPFYFAYVLVAYQRVYSVAPDWSSFFSPPYNTNLPSIFDGYTSGHDLNGLLPACDLSSMLTPALRASLANDPGNPLFQAIRDNDLYRWTPVAPIRLYHCSGDLDVLPANSQVAYSNFLVRGASQVQLIDPSPGTGHGDCESPSLSDAKAWFDSLKH